MLCREQESPCGELVSYLKWIVLQTDLKRQIKSGDQPWSKIDHGFDHGTLSTLFLTLQSARIMRGVFLLVHTKLWEDFRGEMLILILTSFFTCCPLHSIKTPNVMEMWHTRAPWGIHDSCGAVSNRISTILERCAFSRTAIAFYTR